LSFRGLFARRDEKPGRPTVVRPAQDPIQGEFAAIVAMTSEKEMHEH
jgi:hypothetical protein